MQAYLHKTYDEARQCVGEYYSVVSYTAATTPATSHLVPVHFAPLLGFGLREVLLLELRNHFDLERSVPDD